MTKLTPREKKLMTFAIVLISVVSITWWGLLPAWDEYQSLTQELNRKERAYQKAMTSVRLEKDYKANYEGYKKAYQKLKSRYYTGMDEKEAMLKFLGYIEEVIQKSGVDIMSKNPLGLSKLDGYPALQVNLSLRGAPDKMTNLLVNIRESDRAINIERLRIESEQKSGVLQMKMVLSTLLLNEEGDGNEK